MHAWWRLMGRSGLCPGFAIDLVEDLPDELAPQRLYLIGEQPHPWSAALLCPCGCGTTIQLSLIKEDRPSWRARRHFSGSVTLRPSVWRTRGCRSHFFLRRGRIVWSRSVQGDAAFPPAQTRLAGNVEHRDQPAVDSNSPLESQFQKP